MRRNKLINLICGMAVSVFFMLAVVGVLILSGVISLQKNALTFSTESVEALYDGTPLTNHTWNLTEGKLKEGHELKVSFKSSQTNVGETDNIIEVRVTDELGADVTGDYTINYDFGRIKVNPRSITIETATDSKNYDGKPLKNTSFEVLDTGDGLVKGHRADMLMPIFITQPGTVYNTPMEVRILSETGNDVTDNYSITIREGTLTVIGSGSGGGGNGAGGNASGGGGNGSGEGDEMAFDGSSSLVAGEGMQDTVLFSVNSETTENLYLKMESYGDYTGSGWLDATPYREREQISFNSYDQMAFLMATTLAASGQSPTNVQIKSHCGIFAVPYYALPEVSDFIAREQTDVKFAGSTGGIYNVVRVPYANSVRVDKIMLNLEKIYRDFVYNQYLTIDEESNAFMQTLINKNFFDSSDPKIIEKVAKYIQGAAKYNLDYDRALDKESNIAVAFLEKYGQGVCRHYASAATLLYRALGIPARYTVGVLAQAKAGQWVDVTSMNAHAWVEVYIDGIGWRQVEVTGSSSNSGDMSGGEVEMIKSVNLTPKTVRKKYDGTPIYAENVVTGFEAYEAKGYTYKAQVTGERTEAGKSYSTLEDIVIFDKNGRDVTDEFTITRNNGTVQVFYDIVYCYTEDYEKEYDGEAYESAVDIKTKLSDSEYSLETECTTPTSAGKHVNSFTLTITEKKSGRDVTDEYWIVKEYGTATIHRAYLRVEAASAEKAYDGTPLTAGKYSISSGALAKGDRVDMCIFSGSQTEIGRSENAITYLLIMNEKGENVTSNYSIELISGTLRVRMK